MDIIILTFVLYGTTIVSSFHTVLYEYHFINIALPWTEAQQHCRQHYTDLATFWSLDDVYRVKRPSRYDGKAWIGLFDDPASWRGIMGSDSNSWKWSATGTTSPGGYQNWASGEPDFNRATEQCVSILNGSWFDRPCSTESPVVCFTGSLKPGQKNYTLVSTKMTWEDAWTYCREHYTDLAMIEDVTEDSAVSSLYPSLNVWIGLYRKPWRWSDGSQSDFTNWYSDASQPDNRFNSQQWVLEWASYLWNDRPNSDKWPFICQKALEAQKRKRVMMKLQAGIDLSDPAVYHQIKQQVGAELQGKGVTDVNLQWKRTPHRV